MEHGSPNWEDTEGGWGNLEQMKDITAYTDRPYEKFDAGWQASLGCNISTPLPSTDTVLNEGMNAS